MKTRLPLLLLLVGVVGGLLWFSSCTSVSESPSAPNDRNVVIDKRGIFIPGTAISATDHAAMNKILNKYDKSIYRIDTYKDGKRTRKQGTLTDVVTDRKLASQIATNLKRPGFTHYVVQVPGNTTNPASSLNPGSTTNPASAANRPYPPAPAPSPVNPTLDSRELIEELTPILKPYQAQ
jgi:hypothetical protein